MCVCVCVCACAHAQSCPTLAILKNHQFLTEAQKLIFQKRRQRTISFVDLCFVTHMEDRRHSRNDVLCTAVRDANEPPWYFCAKARHLADLAAGIQEYLKWLRTIKHLTLGDLATLGRHCFLKWKALTGQQKVAISSASQKRRWESVWVCVCVCVYVCVCVFGRGGFNSGPRHW